MDSPNGSGQSIGNSSARASPRNCDFCVVVDLADKFNAAAIEQWFDLILEIDLVGAVDLGGDLERNSRSPRDRDGAVGTLFRRDAAEKGEVAAARFRCTAVQLRRDAVVDGSREVCVRDRAPLGIGDRNQRHVAEAQVERVQIGADPDGRAGW